MKNKHIHIAQALATDKDAKGKAYGKKVYDQLHDYFGDRLQVITNTHQNIWCRDFMPVSNGTGELIQFAYRPAYLMETAKGQKTIPESEEIYQELGLQKVSLSTIVLDGGNVELLGDKAIVTDRVFRDNGKVNLVDKQKLVAELKKALAVDQVIVIPQYPYDFTGHVDGLVRFVDEHTVLINDYTEELEDVANDKNSYRRKLMDQWHHSFIDVLLNSRLNIATLPYTANPENGPSSAQGVYLNFLELDDCMVMPTFDDEPNDNQAADRLQALYGKPVERIESLELSKEGGVINCVTWAE
jgi:agmatine deiminase